MKIKILAGGIALLAVVLLTSAVLAQLSISPDSIDVQVNIGENSLPSVNVKNGSEKPTDFEVSLAGYGQGIHGSTEILEPDSNPLSAVPYIKFDPAEFHLEPGETQDVDLSASIPQGTEGGRYAILLITTNPTGEGAIKIVSRLGVLIRLTIAGSHLEREGSTKTIQLGEIEPNKFIPIEVTYANEGNVHYKVQSEVTISDAQEHTLGTLQSKSHVVLPGYSRELLAEWIPASDLQPGIYTVAATITLEDGTELATASEQFELSETYFVPVPPAKPINWLFIGSIIGGIIIIALLVYFLAVRRKRYG